MEPNSKDSDDSLVKKELLQAAQSHVPKEHKMSKSILKYDTKKKVRQSCYSINVGT